MLVYKNQRFYKLTSHLIIEVLFLDKNKNESDKIIKNETENKNNDIDVVDHKQDKLKEYQYTRSYINKNGEKKTYIHKQTHVISLKNNTDELHSYIITIINTALIKVNELKKIEKITKAVLQYRGYNKKNLYQRLHRLEHADEITIPDKKVITDIMGRQKIIAIDLTELLKFILKLYEANDEEIKEMTEKLKQIYEGV